jgi:hypothetical protein
VKKFLWYNAYVWCALILFAFASVTLLSIIGAIGMANPWLLLVAVAGVAGAIGMAMLANYCVDRGLGVSI